MTDADGGADEPLLATELHLFSLSSLLLAIDLHRNFFLSFSLYIYIYIFCLANKKMGKNCDWVCWVYEY